MIKNWFLTMICTTSVTFVLATSMSAQVVVFSNDFEDGDLDAEIGSMTLVADSSTPAVVPVTGGTDPTLGNNVGLFDLNTTALDLTLNLTDTLSLADGNTVSIDFDVAARRTAGLSRTIYVDALDSDGNIVTRFVLGDNNVYGGGGADRQRPGFGTSAGGNMPFGASPGSFWWGSDAFTIEFDALRDAHISLTIGESSFDFSTTRQSGEEFSTTGSSNYGASPSANIAEIQLTSIGAQYGAYFDNVVVEGVVEVAVLLGDVDLNGEVSFLDIAPFITLLSNNGFQPEADIDGNGLVTFLDIGPFIEILSGS